ncbi:acetylxylan esterase [Candidatus Bathyarchaeota archaeon]|nr:acetylxylan esterase [Candidatus Bathyarchaeota archaeon]MBS7612650.1 acetylxylan esterase [Candidatus Bathyarchaeota archaeon]MBS7617233.1 acetylxylan esterase [Candidatus Bathyarchaeota archaeon]
MSREVWSDLNVFYMGYGSMLREHFARLCDELERSRDKPRDCPSWLERRASILTMLRKAMGMDILPERNVKANLVGRVERKGYVLEKVILETIPGLYVSANLYIPSKLEKPVPAVLRVHGHWRHAKHQDAVQATCIGFALRGYVSLAVDKVGYGERRYQGHWEGYILPAVGLTLQAIEAFDNMCAIDYLQSRMEVDPERIGVTGASGGGNQTMYLAALDDRVKAAAPVCSAEVFEDQVASGRCFCECIPSMLKFANVSDVLACIAPRPLLIVSSILDETFPITSARKAFSRVKYIYELMGYGDKIAMYESYAPHGYNREMREAVYRWFDRWLMGVERDGREPEIVVEPFDSDVLKCFHDGIPERGETIFSIYNARYNSLDRFAKLNPDEYLKRREELKKHIIEDVFGGFPERVDLDARTYRVECLDHVIVEYVSFRSEWDIIIPAILLREVDGFEEAHIFLTPSGKSSIFADRRVRETAENKRLAILIDYRGIGETDYDESISAKNSLVLGRHILGMRVFDVLRTVDYLAFRGFLRKKLVIHGFSEAGLIALFATALDSRIDEVEVEGLLASYKVEKTLVQPPSLYPPRILLYADVPEVAALIAPREARIKRPVNSSRAELSVDDTRRLFDFTIRVYDALAAEDAFKIEV